MKIIKNERFDLERSLYHIFNTKLDNVKFEGENDGESVLKESHHLEIYDTKFNLRYPLWHTSYVNVFNSKFLDNSRAPIWYSKKYMVNHSDFNVVKAFRESKEIKVNDSNLLSEEIFWRCKDIEINNTYIEGKYAFFESKNINIEKMTFKGKYSFQYIKNMLITNSFLDTKDAFWHSKDVTVKDSVVKGEYLGWYSKNLTLINCKIIGTQPLCYCKDLKIIDCEFIDCDLAFEYSSVEATIKGSIDSIKNPIKGHIILDDYKELIFNKSKYKTKAIITKREK